MNAILELKNLKKYFQTPRGCLHAVDGINLMIDEGKTLGLVGESGCGKSTLGRVILHLIDNTDGKILFEGEDVTDLNKAGLRHFREKVQIIFQDPFSSLNPRMTVSETISEPLLLNGYISKAEINEETLRLMDTVGLARRYINAYPHELDGGRRQRIGIARALALKPKFIVCDEPVSALDVSVQAQILNLLQDIQEERKLTYIFITHDLSVVKYISHDIAVMYLGQLVEKASSNELFSNPLHPYTKALLSAIPIPDIRIKKNRIFLKGELTSPINPKPGCRFALRCPYATEACSNEIKFEEVLAEHMVACCRVYEINNLSDI